MHRKLTILALLATLAPVLGQASTGVHDPKPCYPASFADGTPVLLVAGGVGSGGTGTG
jgi:hypothetical protein